ncbi:rhodanese-like domain-containing protein [Photobacterium leiognathi]|uniref:rhodanese-like domain-containing protein n=1 Tax=Photobacterium leiognathi TaxID=553611 RepID=UPI00298155CE|nr:rhodanese-like domain-containing protein [Photobacterium leiognathi]
MHIFTDRKDIIIDTRSSDEFIAGHIESSVFVGFGGKQFKWWLELIVPDKTVHLEVIASAKDQASVMETLHELGYIHAELKPLDTSLSHIEHISADKLPDMAETHHILDVRETDETEKGKLASAEALPLTALIQGKMPAHHDDYVVHCAGGYRSLIAISLLKVLNKCHLIQLDGGYSAIQRTQ